MTSLENPQLQLLSRFVLERTSLWVPPWSWWCLITASILTGILFALVTLRSLRPS